MVAYVCKTLEVRLYTKGNAMLTWNLGTRPRTAHLVALQGGPQGHLIPNNREPCFIIYCS